MARRVEVALVGDSSSLERALNRSGKSGIGLGKMLASGGLVAGAALIGVGVAAFKAADQHDKAIKKIAVGTKPTMFFKQDWSE